MPPWKHEIGMQPWRHDRANPFKKVLFAVAKPPGLDLVKARLDYAGKVSNSFDLMAAKLGIDRGLARAKFHAIEHHRTHLVSAFCVSTYTQATLVSTDGFGDFA